MGELAKHQIAANWADEISTHLPWLERGSRAAFLEAVLAVVMDEWTTTKLAIHLAYEHPDPESLSAVLAKEVLERFGEDELATPPTLEQKP